MEPMTPETLRPLELLLTQAVAWGPRMLMGLLVLLLGLVLSLIGERLTRWLVRRSGLEALAERLGVAKLLYGLGLKHGLARVTGKVVQVVLILISVALAAETLGLPGFAEGIGVLLEFFPRLVTASLVILGGMFGADLLARLVRRLGQRREDLQSPELLSRIVHGGVMAMAFALAAEQLGLAVTLVNTILSIVVGGLVFGTALAFALGSRGVFENLVSTYYARRTFRAGDRIRALGQRGVIERYGALGAFVRTEQGLTVMPSSRLVNEVVEIEDQAEGPIGDVEAT